MVLRLLAPLLLCCACIAPSRGSVAPGVRVASLGAGGDDPPGFAALARDFEAANPGYGLAWHGGVNLVEPRESVRVLFVQGGGAYASVGNSVHPRELTVGDVVLLPPGRRLEASAPLDLLEFSVPADARTLGGLPQTIRPDWAPNITDEPGGCATETGAYRRLILTRAHTGGAYVFDALNAHRVRIQDSFTHYHPREGGFDEFYLVQMANPESRILTSEHVDAVVERRVTAEEVSDLFHGRTLEVGDLVYLPRGTIHRGVGGPLVQVIAVPGFLQGAELGVDEPLAALNAALGLTGEDALPVHVEAQP